MTPIDRLFEDLRRQRQKALLPFIAAGDPDLSLTRQLLEVFRDVGCQVCELGFPYSDPIADGPTIQAAFIRALQGGLKVEQIFQMLGTQPNRPLTVAMLSYAIVHRIGLDAFVAQASQAGISGLIVPDLPAEEAASLRNRCETEHLALIQLITPTTRPERAKRIVDLASGFIYYVSVAGVTGQRQHLPPEILDSLAELRQLTALPICVGFGISTPEHVRQLAPHCDGVIVGSAIVRVIEQGLAQRFSAATILGEVRQFCESLQAALHSI